ncbi:MAG: SRPBCC domain-containing protein, partial [Gemmatimonadota bacterium]|nr:SRPBCC domain-containing protein [Gemmatimonadota bacterium]
LKVGGRYRLAMRSAEGKSHTAVGTYREIVRPTRLVYTWSWEEGGSNTEETLVTVEFNAVGGATEVVLTHERFATAESRDDHLRGWTSCVDRLEAIYV